MGVKKKQIWIDYKYSLLFLIFLLLATILFLVYDGHLDRVIGNFVYDGSLPIGERFIYQNDQPWLFLNEENKIIAYSFAIPLLLMWFVSLLFKEKYSWKRKHLSFAVFSIITSTFIIVEAVFKGFYGRPRPRQTELWPDSYESELWPFYHVWEPAFLDNPDLIGEGVSFPSGHVAGYAAFIVLFYLLRNSEFWAKMTTKNCDPSDYEKKYARKLLIFKILKYIGLFMGTVVTVLSGIGRIVAGAHHGSDVLWSIAFVFIVNQIFYYWVYKIPQHEKKILAAAAASAQ